MGHGDLQFEFDLLHEKDGIARPAGRGVSLKAAPTAPQGREAMASVPVEREAPAPEVHVSIGRIELRIASPPPSPATARSEPPRLMLDDYLRRARTRP